MSFKRISVQQDEKSGGYYVTVDGGVMRCSSELGAYAIVKRAMGFDADSASDEIQNLNEKIAVLRKELEKAEQDYKEAIEDYEFERSEKNKFMLEVYELKQDIVKLARIVTRNVNI